MPRKRPIDADNPDLEGNPSSASFPVDYIAGSFWGDGRRNIEDNVLLDSQDLEKQDSSAPEYMMNSHHATANKCELSENQFLDQQKRQISTVYDSNSKPVAMPESGDNFSKGIVDCNCAPVEDAVRPSPSVAEEGLPAVLPCLGQLDSCQMTVAGNVLKKNDNSDEEFIDPYDRDYDALWLSACGGVDDSITESNVSSKSCNNAVVDVIELPFPSWFDDSVNSPVTMPINVLPFSVQETGSQPANRVADLAYYNASQPKITGSYGSLAEDFSSKEFGYEHHDSSFSSDTTDDVILGRSIPVVISSNAEDQSSSSDRHRLVWPVVNFNTYEINDDKDHLCSRIGSAAIYNGSLERGYTEIGDVRSPLLYTPLPSQKHQKHIGQKICCSNTRYDPLPAVHKAPSHSPQKRSADNLVWLRFVEEDDQQGPSPKMKRRNSAKPTRNDNRFLIILDSAILEGKLDPSELEHLLNRASLEDVLEHRRFEVLYHRYVEDEMRRKRDDIATPFDEKHRVCRYLSLFSTFGKMNLMKRMDRHRCDSSKGSENDQIACLIYNLRVVKEKDRSVNLFYMTDLETCSIQTNRIRRGVQFVQYGSWEDIFTQ